MHEHLRTTFETNWNLGLPNTISKPPMLDTTHNASWTTFPNLRHITGLPQIAPWLGPPFLPPLLTFRVDTAIHQHCKGTDVNVPTYEQVWEDVKRRKRQHAKYWHPDKQSLWEKEAPGFAPLRMRAHLLAFQLLEDFLLANGPLGLWAECSAEHERSRNGYNPSLNEADCYESLQSSVNDFYAVFTQTIQALNEHQLAENTSRSLHDTMRSSTPLYQRVAAKIWQDVLPARHSMIWTLIPSWLLDPSTLALLGKGPIVANRHQRYFPAIFASSWHVYRSSLGHKGHESFFLSADKLEKECEVALWLLPPHFGLGYHPIAEALENIRPGSRYPPAVLLSSSSQLDPLGEFRGEVDPGYMLAEDLAVWFRLLPYTILARLWQEIKAWPLEASQALLWVLEEFSEAMIEPRGSANIA